MRTLWPRKIIALLSACGLLGTAAGLVAAPALGAGRCGTHAWCDPARTADERAGLLLGALTQDEKVSLLAGDELVGVLGVDRARHTGVGRGVARVGLPDVLYSDGPVGPRQGESTAMPIPMALAATWDPELARRHGETIASEARAKGNDVVFAPTVNLMRVPTHGPHVRELRRGPVPRRPHGVGVDQGRAVHGRDRQRQALRRKQPGGRGAAAALSHAAASRSGRLERWATV